MQQEQFLNVVDRDEAERRFRAVLDLRPLEAEEIALASALARVLARDVVAPVDVPSFDRSNVDGFAVRAEDTFGACEDRPASCVGPVKPKLQALRRDCTSGKGRGRRLRRERCCRAGPTPLSWSSTRIRTVTRSL